MLSVLRLSAICAAQLLPQPWRSRGSLLTYSSCARSVSVIGAYRRRSARGTDGGAGYVVGFCAAVAETGADARSAAIVTRANDRIMAGVILWLDASESSLAIASPAQPDESADHEEAEDRPPHRPKQ